jgi:predicted O-methyltransferase YrrM
MGIVEKMAGVRILEEVDSPINGHLTVITDFTWGPHILSKITQSGGILKKIWGPTLRKLKHRYFYNDPTKVLVFGLGGGTVAWQLREVYPNIKITGVEIDPMMVDLGKKHLKWDEETEVIIGDAVKVVKRLQKEKQKYDLVLVDMYVGEEVPEKISNEAFVKQVASLVQENGIAVFNRTYYGDMRDKAHAFEKILEKVFPQVDRFYPEANCMFIAKRQ